jgi:molecular chaperone GrpE
MAGEFDRDGDTQPGSIEPGGTEHGSAEHGETQHGGTWGRFARWSGIGQNKKGTETMNENDMNNEQAVAVDGEYEEQGDAQAVQGSSLEAEVEQLRTERDGLKDRLLRLQAEFDNARRREVKERQDARDYATQSAIEPFLGVMDNFDLALKATGSADQLRSGVELILKQMDEAVRSLNVQPVASVGQQFDPHVHEALGSVETVEYPDHQVIEEIRRGYKLRDKLLRPALVKIAVNSAQVND